MSTFYDSNFRADGWRDCEQGRPPSPPDPLPYATEYMEGYAKCYAFMENEANQTQQIGTP